MYLKLVPLSDGKPPCIGLYKESPRHPPPPPPPPPFTGDNFCSLRADLPTLKTLLSESHDILSFLTASPQEYQSHGFGEKITWK